MKRLREYAKDQISVTENTEGSRRGKQFQPDVSKKEGKAVPLAIASVVDS